VCTRVGKAGTSHQTHVTRSNDGNFHGPGLST
jgi:hypothetical protein